jgi:hypothetical protein
MALLVPDGGAAEPVVGPAAAGRLAALGITRVSLLGDGGGIGVFLEGWAFDPAMAADAASVVFPGGARVVRVLHEVESVAVSRHPARGGGE